MSRPTPPTHEIENWRAHSEALKRRGALTIWFGPGMTWQARPAGKRGRQPAHETLFNRRLGSVSCPAHQHHATPGPAGIFAMKQWLDSDHESQASEISTILARVAEERAPRLRKYILSIDKLYSAA